MFAPDNSPSASVTDTTIHDPRQRRAILIAVCVALMAVIASVSGLNVAQQQIAAAFDASQSPSSTAGNRPCGQESPSW